MLRKGSDFTEESVERVGEKNRLMKAVQSSSHISLVPSLSSSSHVFASLELVNVFMRVGFGSTIKLVSFDESQVVTFNGKFVCGFRNGDCGTGSQSDNKVDSPHMFVIHGIEVLKGNKKITKVVDVENWRIDNSRVLRWIVSLIEWNSSVLSTKSSIQSAFRLRGSKKAKTFETTPGFVQGGLNLNGESNGSGEEVQQVRPIGRGRAKKKTSSSSCSQASSATRRGDVNDAMRSKKKTVMVSSDPLALIAEKTKVSKSNEKVVISSDLEGSEADDFSELKKIAAFLPTRNKSLLRTITRKLKRKMMRISET
nr:hypothetical protein [Tanacetum cinerariifolium]